MSDEESTYCAEKCNFFQIIVKLSVRNFVFVLLVNRYHRVSYVWSICFSNSIIMQFCQLQRDKLSFFSIDPCTRYQQLRVSSVFYSFTTVVAVVIAWVCYSRRGNLQSRPEELFQSKNPQIGTRQHELEYDNYTVHMHNGYITNLQFYLLYTITKTCYTISSVVRQQSTCT